ncbi:MAG TPA: histidine phosphatase family protein [Gemmatimonadales bacterium]|nr:histidine phosphatase family protein [Gemmatimonadales bacterium]
MLLLLIRHADAEAQDPAAWPDDSLRPLIPRGKKRHRRAMEALRDRGHMPTHILSSPWRRAWQTAGVTARVMGLDKAERIPCEALAMPPDFPAIAQAIGDVGAEGPIALVGHEPWMSGLAALLLTGRVGGLSIDFPKSATMGIEMETMEPGTGELRFFL